MNAGLAERIERCELRLQERLAAQRTIDVVVQAVELEIDFEPIAVASC